MSENIYTKEKNAGKLVLEEISEKEYGNLKPTKKGTKLKFKEIVVITIVALIISAIIAYPMFKNFVGLMDSNVKYFIN